MIHILREKIVANLNRKFEAEIGTHATNIEILLEQGVGVAEHPDIMATIEGELNIIANFEDKRTVLNKYFGEKTNEN